MPADLLLKALIAMAPVLLLLLVFDRLDVFNLIPMGDIALLTLTGAALALFSYFANISVMDGFPIGFTSYSRYVAPVIEETMKAAPVIFLFARNRLGFKLDAAIAGFAVGAGFSMAENLWYLVQLDHTNISDWLVRGFGTAIMHGASTALFAVISHEWSERQSETTASHYRFQPLLFVPGLLVAMVVHSLFNHLPAEPLVAMVLTLLLAPMTLFFTLARSERATREWLAADAAAHRQLLEEIRAGRFGESKTGAALRQHLDELKTVNTEDALAYAELKMELVLAAEESILATHQGTTTPANDIDRDKFDRLDVLEHHLGRAVAAAISSRIGFTRNDLYELGRLRARVMEKI